MKIKVTYRDGTVKHFIFPQLATVEEILAVISGNGAVKFFE